MQRKFLPYVYVLLLAALFALSGDGMAKGQNGRPHQNISPSLSNEERILLLESFMDQQRDYNTQLDTRLINHMNGLVQAQNGIAQTLNHHGEQINQVESRLDVVYRFGALIAFVLTLSVPVFLWILNKSQAHNAKIAASISTLASDVRIIKTVCNISGIHIPHNPPSIAEGEESPA